LENISVLIVVQRKRDGLAQPVIGVSVNTIVKIVVRGFLSLSMIKP